MAAQTYKTSTTVTWQSVKHIFGGIKAVSREATECRGGFYHINIINDIKFSHGTENIS